MNQFYYKEIIADSICNDIKKARDDGIVAGAIILTLSAIDAMAYLSMPLKQKEVHRKDYIDWVEKYLKTDSNQQYQYRGVDLYGARCGIVHRYSFSSRLSESGQCRIFVYSNGSEHIYKPNSNKEMVIISIRRFTNDFFNAVKNFIKDIRSNENLRLRADSRINYLFMVGKISKNGKLP